jgi:putative glutamine amidotransferase
MLDRPPSSHPPPGPPPALPATSLSQSPLIGITVDVAEVAGGRFRLDCSAAYADAITAAGGIPILLTPDPALVDGYLALCDGFVLTGGDDPRTEEFAPHHDATHPAAKPIHARRQAFETALLQALQNHRPQTPVLGICLGMQMMALHAGGRLNQHLPDSFPTADRHRREGPSGSRASHTIRIDPAAAARAGHHWLGGHAGSADATVDSHHHQAVAVGGSLAVVGHSDDGLIEAIAAPGRRFYLGVQWHPERTRAEALGAELFRRLIAAARATVATQAQLRASEQNAHSAVD